MSHHDVHFSPPGTPLLDRSVGELVSERPGRSRIFQAAAIDFCCQGGRTLREACERKGVDSAGIVAQLEAELEGNPAPEFNPATLPAHELCDYIVGNHHEFVRRELPRLHAMSERVARVHGGHTPSLIDVFQVFLQLAQELASHISKEEQVLFPAISSMSRGERERMSLDGPIACMIHEHDDAGELMARLRKLTNGFQPPAEACNTYRALFAGLQDFEEDLHRHIHLENAVLFPAAESMAA